MNTAAPLPAGLEIHGYRIRSLLSSEGSFGLIYVATDTRLDRVARRHAILRQRVEAWRRAGLETDEPSPGPEVVIKEFLPSELSDRGHDGLCVAPRSSKRAIFEWSRSRFVDEARFLAGHSHPNVVSVFDIVGANNTQYMVMELLSGGALLGLVERGEVQTEAQVRRWLRPVLQGLASVEARGVNHLDLSPSNIAYRRPGGQPVLLDFGAARLVRVRRSGTRMIVNDGYSAPEKYRTTSTRLDARADIYALGGVINYALTGERPHGAMERLGDAAMASGLSPKARAARARRASPAFLAGVDACFALDPAQRPATALAAEQRLGPWPTSPSSSPTPSPLSPPPPRPPPQPWRSGPEPMIPPQPPERWVVVTLFGLLIVLLVLLMIGPTLNGPADAAPVCKGAALGC